ncbi:CRTAC1 family protein [Opitutus terrae]|uniref:CRTAC1 family protein n=1 Tax=Opitutus terrae TaxID=107709 RepID=UPI000320E576|nr:CRTAC1 family protein [Opitutus terrae]
MCSSLTTALAAPPANPEFCAPSSTLTSAPADLTEQPASTQRMAARLREIAEASISPESPYEYPRRAEALRQIIERTSDSAERIKFLPTYAHDLLRAGEPEPALAALATLEQLLTAEGHTMTPVQFTTLHTIRALAYLRLGEQENCLLNHNADSCLFPIRGGGVHPLTRGSRGAVDALTTLLTRYPGDLRARWLLNIAHMTLGEYPDGVPAQWRIDPQHFASARDLPRFPDVAGRLGIDVDDLAGGVIMDDFDRDGFLDLMVSAWGPYSQLRTFRNNGNGTFTERTAAAGLTGETGGLNLIQADYNNDGFVDVLVLRGAWLRQLGHYPNSLLRNNGNGTFTDVTAEAGLLSFHPTQTAAWFDFDGDGHLDLFIGNESAPDDVHPCELFRSNGDGTFTECAAANGVAAVGYVKGVVTGDYNNDGRPDLYLSRRDGANLLLRNDGPADAACPRGTWRFTDMAREAGVTEPYGSFSCWFWDYDNDGWLDLMVTGYAIQDVGDIAADYLGLPHPGEYARLYRNRRDGTFADVTREQGLHQVLHTMGCNFGDLDNDGWLDFYVGTGDPDFATLLPNRMFRNDGGRGFQDVTASGGFGQLQKGHGIAFGDIDNDGDEDIYSVVGGAVNADNYRNQLFANPGLGGHWLTLTLEGVRSNRLALGTRIKVVVATPAGEREIHRAVGSGGSFGASPLQQHIGLGDASRILRVEIFWPATGQIQRLENLALDRSYLVREDAAAAIAVEVRSFRLPTDPSPDHPSHQHASAPPVPTPHFATSR